MHAADAVLRAMSRSSRSMTGPEFDAIRKGVADVAAAAAAGECVWWFLRGAGEGRLHGKALPHRPPLAHPPVPLTHYPPLKIRSPLPMPSLSLFTTARCCVTHAQTSPRHYMKVYLFASAGNVSMGGRGPC